jgi:hypothetical protein
MSEDKNCSNGDFHRFKELTRKLVSVPKSEIDKKEAAYQRKKAASKKKRNRHV